MVVAVGGDPFTAVFDCQGREEGIGNQIAFDVGRGAEMSEDFLVSRTGIHDGAVGLIAEFSGKSQRFRHRAGGIEDLWMGHDAEKAAQHEVGHTVGVIGVNQLFEPVTIWIMVRRILPVGVDEHIDVKKDHEAAP